MDSQDVVPKKKRGPKPTGHGVQVQVRLQPELLEALDRFIADRGAMTRPEGLRIAFREWAVEHQLLAENGGGPGVRLRKGSEDG